MGEGEVLRIKVEQNDEVCFEAEVGEKVKRRSPCFLGKEKERCLLTPGPQPAADRPALLAFVSPSPPSLLFGIVLPSSGPLEGTTQGAAQWGPRLYNHSDILEEDLETCRAAVLHQFLRPLSAGDSSEKQVRSEQAAAAALLRAHLGQRVTTLQEHDNSIREEVAKSSEVFPVKNMDQMTRATALLKKALTEECEARSAIHSNESSCSLPSILNDNSGIKEAKPAQWLNSVCTKEQEVSSGCGDESKEESMAAKIPITETKAYQLLKQSTLQDNINHTEDRFQKADVSVLQLSGLNIGSGTFKTKTTNKIVSEASFSSSKGSPLSRHENEKKLPTTLESKAFWGESDDSNSEIEAALRPRNHNTSADDFDDFYD
ncbi:centrosomal protein kizuna-like [Mustela nigripes]|uniref:centrosomal protein kizuna-like n=1 Tax=Mustela nigripes TaxID=77151 RepID=UPI00281544CB|nr:centrosomal protein kizuna-like [Mustela nigripes]